MGDSLRDRHDPSAASQEGVVAGDSRFPSAEEGDRAVSALLERNERLDLMLREAREHITTLRSEVERLTAPPGTYGVVSARNDDGTCDVWVSGRKMRVTAGVDADDLRIGAEVALNDALSIVAVRDPELVGEIVTLSEMLEDGFRVVVSRHGNEEVVCELSDSLRGRRLRHGDLLRMDPRSHLVLERLDRPETDHLLLEEIPDVSYRDIGGLDEQIERIADAVELPYLHQELFGEYRLEAPKGILLYGPPGCGKTLIAKAVANSLGRKVAEAIGDDKGRSYFFNVKGPELLNKYVGETERQIRLIFERAREKSEEGWPVIIFFDEMDSMFRTRGSGVSSDMESTIVPQLLAEIDGVEGLRNVIVIGATNREDLIDPAILRPGRLDVKIRIERPDEHAAVQVLARYLTSDVPICTDLLDATGGDTEEAVARMIRTVVGEMYAKSPENEFLEITYQNGEKEVLYYKDFASGAMLENVVRRAKQLAIKRVIAGGPAGVREDDLRRGFRMEFAEHDDLPNTTNPDDWAKISGRKGERIVYIRTIAHGRNARGVKAIEPVVTGHYL
jgi:proteasome-associated ATPase